MISRMATVSTALATRFLRCERGSMLTIFAVAVPVLMGTVGIGIDYAKATLLRSKMQVVADHTALMAARQMRRTTETPDTASSLAKSYIASQIDGVTATVKVDTNALRVDVTLVSDFKPAISGSLIDSGMVHISATATAKLDNRLPLSRAD